MCNDYGEENTRVQDLEIMALYEAMFGQEDRRLHELFIKEREDMEADKDF